MPFKKRKLSSVTYLCTTCDTVRVAKSFPEYNPSSGCEHLINTCKACLKGWATTQIETNSFVKRSADEESDKENGKKSETPALGIRCPECPGVMEAEDVKHAVLRRTYDEFVKLNKKYVLESNPGWIWCLSPYCDAGQIHTPVAESKSKSKHKNKDSALISECNTCHYRSCVACVRPWHQGETCAAYQLRIKDKVDEEDLSIKHMEKDTKKCPGCSFRIEKRGGCQSMICSNCSKNFCWNCLKLFKNNGCACTRAQAERNAALQAQWLAGQRAQAGGVPPAAAPGDDIARDARFLATLEPDQRRAYNNHPEF